MKNCLPIALLCLPGCSLFGGLSEEDLQTMNEHRIRCQKYFNSGMFKKAIDQAERGLSIDPSDYALRSRLGWSYLELSSRSKDNNIEHLRRARTLFEEIMEWRGIDEHDTRTIFGYAKSLHNEARVSQLQARLLTERSVTEPDKKSEFLAQAKQFTELANKYDRDSEHYFLTLAEGDVAARANKREAYEYLMVLKYRAKDYKAAIQYGNKNLELTAAETKHWNDKYKTTKLADYEALVQEELSRLGKSAAAVHSSLAKYHRESKNYDEAIAHLDEVIAARPRNYREYYRRAVCYRNKSDHARARKDFQTFLQMSDLPETDKNFQDAYEYVHGRGK